MGERTQEQLTPPGTRTNDAGPAAPETRPLAKGNDCRRIRSRLRARGRMGNGQQHDGRVRLAKEIILRIFVYGIPITIGALGFILGWWEKMATGGE